MVGEDGGTRRCGRFRLRSRKGQDWWRRGEGQHRGPRGFRRRSRRLRERGQRLEPRAVGSAGAIVWAWEEARRVDRVTDGRVLVDPWVAASVAAVGANCDERVR